MYAKKHIKIKGKEMAYIDEGQGDPIVFLHGNPTSSYLWRNIAPHVEGLGRIVIPDLIGMGDSEKLNNIDDPGYKYHGQYDYLTSLLEELDLGNNINLVPSLSFKIFKVIGFSDLGLPQIYFWPFGSTSIIPSSLYILDKTLANIIIKPLSFFH